MWKKEGKKINLRPEKVLNSGGPAGPQKPIRWTSQNPKKGGKCSGE